MGDSRVPGHMSMQILSIACPRCGYGFATASHKYYKDNGEGRTFVSDIMCAAENCTYLKEATSYGPDAAMRKVLKIYLNDLDDKDDVVEPVPAAWASSGDDEK